MFLWRLTPKVHAAKPLNRDGARRFGGRWNHVGTAVVYTSGSLSLAVLEYLVNLPINDLPSDVVSIQLGLPDELRRTEIGVKDLPRTWRAFPAVEELKDLGTNWVTEGKTAVLVVPSAVIPNELNYVINPAHPDTKKIEKLAVEPFTLDTRLFQTGKRRRSGKVVPIR